MKKRLISIILVAVMLVATIPAFSASAATVDSYRTTLTSKNIAVDGVLDEAYKTSQKITSSFWGTGNSSNLSFEAYTAVTLRGVYVWAEIKDNSLVKSASHPAGEGDKFQIYIRMSNGTDDVWGWYDTDYNGNISKAVKAGSLGTPTYATTKIYDGSGWRSEIFIPFEGSLTIENVSAAKIYIGLQANNATYTNGATSNTAYCYDKDARSPYYYNGNDLYSPLNLISTGDVPSDVGGKSAVYVKGSSPTIDGTKDASYSEHAKIALGYVIKDSAYTGADTRSDLGHVYLSFDNYYLYIYYETVDTDLNSNDYFQVYYHFNNNGSPTAGYFCSKIDPTGSIYYGSTGSSYGYPGTALSAPTATGQFRAVGKSLGNNKYALEYRIPLPTGERSAISANGGVNVKLDFSANDYDANGTRKFYGGCTSYSTAMYNYDYITANYEFPEVSLYKAFTDANPAVIVGANVALGSDITVNYYTVLGPADVSKASMRFTRGDNDVFVAYPVAYRGGEYKFALEGLAPQSIGDNIKAEVLIDGVVVATHDNYSILENCLNIYNNSAYSASSYNNMKMLIKALLNYGAAAQNYVGHRVNALVNEDFEITLSSPTAINNVKSVGSAISSSLKFTAVGVYFDTSNKIYAKFTATSLSGVSVMINNFPATIQKVDGESNMYIVYSDGIPVTEFGSEYKITLSNGSSSQSVIYSVNSYTYAKCNDSDTKLAALAKATFTYGEMARKYADYGPVSYKVMTFNDGDNTYAADKNYEKVAVIIKDYAPDLVGMQEVQKAHGNGSSSYYGTLLTDYGIVYYNHEYPNTTVVNGLSEKNNPYGNMILYRKDKFTLLASGRRWLTSTPDTASRVEGSEWTRTYVWAKLQDKRTGETFVFISTHIDYTGAQYDSNENLLYNPRLEQTKYLFSHTKAQFGDLPIIYTADWNFSKGSDAYNYVNSQGYYATETIMPDAYVPGNSIDICFVDPDEYQALNYKVINDHVYSATASDHKAVITEIVRVEIAPEAVLGDTIIGPFNSPDDREGF